MAAEIEWDCRDCFRSYEMAADTAERRLERTTVYQSDRVADAYVCYCGGLLDPFLDDI